MEPLKLVWHLKSLHVGDKQGPKVARAYCIMGRYFITIHLPDWCGNNLGQLDQKKHHYSTKRGARIAIRRIISEWAKGNLPSRIVKR